MKKIYLTQIAVCGALFLFLSAPAAHAFTGETVNPVVERSLTQTAPAETEDSSQVSVEGAPMMAPESRWQFKPGLAFDTVFDSNVNRGKEGERNEDIVFETTPSLRVLRQGGIVSLNSGYQVQYQRFVRSRDPHLFNHDADLDLEVKFSRFKISTNEDFLHKRTFASSEQTERRTIMVNRLRNEFAYDLTSATTIAAIVQNDVFRYGETVVKENSYLTNKYGGRVYYHATSIYDFFLDSGYHENRYYRSNDSKNSHGFWTGVGVKGLLSERAAVNFNAGFKRREYVSSDFAGDNNWYAEGGLRYRLTQRINAILLLKRDLQESISNTASSYRANRASLDFDYSLSAFVKMKLGTYIQYNNYLNNNTPQGVAAGDQSDWLNGGNLGIEWEPIDNCYLSAKYELDMRTGHTSTDSDSYIRHVVTTGLAYKV